MILIWLSRSSHIIMHLYDFLILHFAHLLIPRIGCHASSTSTPKWWTNEVLEMSKRSPIDWIHIQQDRVVIFEIVINIIYTRENKIQTIISIVHATLLILKLSQHLTFLFQLQFLLLQFLNSFAVHGFVQLWFVINMLKRSLLQLLQHKWRISFTGIRFLDFLCRLTIIDGLSIRLLRAVKSLVF